LVLIDIRIKNFENPARLFDPSVNVCQSTSTLDLLRPLANPSVTVPTDQAFLQACASGCVPTVGDYCCYPIFDPCFDKFSKPKIKK
jgi:hypothetical protein